MTLEQTIEKIVRAVVEASDPERIILFGSAARGEVGPDSDVDLMVVQKESSFHGGSRGEESSRIHQALRGFLVPIDILIVTPEEVEHWKGTTNHVIARSFREGRVVYSGSRKSFPNGVALLDKPAVAPASESVIIFENLYMTDRDDAERVLRLAGVDFKAICHMMDSEYFEDSVFGFHAQQAVEKALKAWLCLRGILYPKTHDLRVLGRLIEANGEQLPSAFAVLIILNRFAVQFRYDPLSVPAPLNRGELVSLVESVLEHVKQLIEEAEAI